VHFVTNELDSGAIILQKSVAIESNDTAKSLAAKVLEQEHILYPMAIKKVLQK
jgi:phosphoribosylglycinamide formyltransferase-1